MTRLDRLTPALLTAPSALVYAGRAARPALRRRRASALSLHGSSTSRTEFLPGWNLANYQDLPTDPLFGEALASDVPHRRADHPESASSSGCPGSLGSSTAWTQRWRGPVLPRRGRPATGLELVVRQLPGWMAPCQAARTAS
ncbi:hypothetical protein ACU4GR_12840 [Methylobacterium oryzae CBMB20]